MTHTEQRRIWVLAIQLGWVAPIHTNSKPLRTTVGPRITPPTHTVDRRSFHLDDGSPPYRPITLRLVNPNQ